MTAQPSRAMSVGRSVVRRRLTVMLTMTTDDDSATHSPTSAAASRSRPASINTAAARPVEITTWSGAAQSSGPWSRRSRAEVHLDADLEEQQHDADVGEQLELVVVRDVARV